MSLIHTRGNKHAHIVLRGGGGKTNFDVDSVSTCEQQLLKSNLPANIMIDCSHENSSKNHERQALVMDDAANQIVQGNRSIVGFMVESNLAAGNQKIPANKADLQYGVSITDACVDWATTEDMVRNLRERVKDVLPNRPSLTIEDLMEHSA